MTAIVEDTTGVCVCGHPLDKHRNKGTKTCKKCKCTKYRPAEHVEGQMVELAHATTCSCAECAWQRLENAERNLFNLNEAMKTMKDAMDATKDATIALKDELQAYKDYVQSELYPSKQMVDNIAKAVENTREAQMIKADKEIAPSVEDHVEFEEEAEKPVQEDNPPTQDEE